MNERLLALRKALTPPTPPETPSVVARVFTEYKLDHHKPEHSDFRTFWKAIDPTDPRAITKAFKVIFDFPEIFGNRADMEMMEFLEPFGWAYSRLQQLREWGANSSKFSRPQWVMAYLDANGLKVSKVKSFID